MSSLDQILQALRQQNIIGKQGTITINLAGLSVPLATKDIVGSVLQEWLAKFMTTNNIIYRNGGHTQSWPDFILSDETDLEVKAFDGNGNPNFDLANFDTYIRSLLTEPQRLDTDHLIFEYVAFNYSIEIKNFYIKKIWEMTGESEANILSVQKKQGVIYNIRPKNWRSQKVKVFNTRLEFVQCIKKVLHDYKSAAEAADWYNKVLLKYNEKTGHML